MNKKLKCLKCLVWWKMNKSRDQVSYEYNKLLDRKDTINKVAKSTKRWKDIKKLSKIKKEIKIYFDKNAEEFL